MLALDGVRDCLSISAIFRTMGSCLPEKRQNNCSCLLSCASWVERRTGSEPESLMFGRVVLSHPMQASKIRKRDFSKSSTGLFKFPNTKHKT